MNPFYFKYEANTRESAASFSKTVRTFLYYRTLPSRNRSQTFMNWIQTFSGLATKRLPKVMSPKSHAIADYALAAGAFIAAIAFFRSNRKAAGVAALVAGTIQTVNPLITDFPGGAFKVIDFPTHGRIDAASTGMIASLPQLIGFAQEPESRFFLLHASVATAVIAMTDFERAPF